MVLIYNDFTGLQACYRIDTCEHIGSTLACHMVERGRSYCDVSPDAAALRRFLVARSLG